MNIKAVIFDMDGTLLDTQKICIEAWDFAGEKQGFENIGRYIPEVCGMNEAGWTEVLKGLIKGGDLKKFKDDSRDYIIKNLKVEFKEGASQTLEFLKQKNVKMALASGSSMGSIMHHLQEVDAAHFFQVMVGSTDVKNGKPAPDIFLLAAEKLGVEPSECIVFEDSENGIKAAHSAGMKAIGIPDLKGFSEDTKKLMFKEMKTMREAIALFEQLF